MSKISVLDYAFLALENADSPKHVAGLALFQRPRNAGPGFLAGLLERMKRVTPTPPFNYTLSYSMLRVPYWQETENVDLDWHVRHVALPAPGRMRELMNLIARLHASRLDRSRPLWEFYLVEGLEGNRFAMYFKIHHAYMDGLSMSRRITQTLATSADDKSLTPIWGQRKRRGRRKRGPADDRGVLSAGLQTAANALGSLPEFGRLAWAHSAKTLGFSDDAVPVPFMAPRTRLNRPLTPPRSTAIADLALDRVKRVARQAGVSVNDVLLSACDGALQAYLDAADARPDKPLVAEVPISVRRSPEDTAGNQITVALVELATGIEDPVERLRAISKQAQDVKSIFSRMSAFTATSYTLLMQAVAQIGELLPIADKVPLLGNVVISNVIGPEKRLYMGGAELTGIYPMSTIGPGLSINITFYTYAGQIHAGIVAGREAIPDLQRMANLIVTEFETLDKALHAASASDARRRAAG